MVKRIDYVEWKEDYQDVLMRLPGKKLFLMYSGGKDSSLCMDFMLRAGHEFGFSLEAHAGALPIHRYTEEEKKRLADYWARRGVRVVWHNIGMTDETLEASQNPCLTCQKARKMVLNEVLAGSVKDWTNLVLIVSFSLWDIVGYSIEHVLGNLYSAQEGREEGRQRFVETAQRFYPLLKLKEGYTVFRPLIKFNGPDIVEFVKREAIPILSVPCRFKEYRPKRILEYYYEKIGLRFDYDQVLEFASKSLNLPDLSTYASLDKDEYLKKVF
jgi:tRNA(Ile)-lysidine synthase TilS/MesJ